MVSNSVLNWVRNRFPRRFLKSGHDILFISSTNRCQRSPPRSVLYASFQASNSNFRPAMMKRNSQCYIQPTSRPVTRDFSKIDLRPDERNQIYWMARRFCFVVLFCHFGHLVCSKRFRLEFRSNEAQSHY